MLAIDDGLTNANYNWADIFFLVGEIAGGKLRVAKGDLRLQLRGRAYAPVVARVDPVGIADEPHVAGVAVAVDERMPALRVAIGERCGGLRRGNRGYRA